MAGSLLKYVAIILFLSEVGRGRSSRGRGRTGWPLNVASSEASPSQGLAPDSILRLKKLLTEAERPLPRSDNLTAVVNIPEDLIGDDEICMEKVVMVEEIVFDEEVVCEHTIYESCIQTFQSSFETTKRKRCETKFVKDCTVEYRDEAKPHQVQVCNEKLTRDCNSTAGPEICTTEDEVICETIYDANEVEEDVPNCDIVEQEVCKDQADGTQLCETVPVQQCQVGSRNTTKITKSVDCKVEPVQVCGPEDCPIVKGDNICFTEIRQIVHQVPVEDCQITPQKSCKEESFLVPSLKPVKQCMEIPKEVCVKSKVKPVRRRRPQVKTWCGPQNLTELATASLNEPNVTNTRIGVGSQAKDNDILYLKYVQDGNSAISFFDLASGEEICRAIGDQYDETELLTSATSSSPSRIVVFNDNDQLVLSGVNVHINPDNDTICQSSIANGRANLTMVYSSSPLFTPDARALRSDLGGHSACLGDGVTVFVERDGQVVDIGLAEQTFRFVWFNDQVVASIVGQKSESIFDFANARSTTSSTLRESDTIRALPNFCSAT